MLEWPPAEDETPWSEPPSRRADDEWLGHLAPAFTGSLGPLVLAVHGSVRLSYLGRKPLCWSVCVFVGLEGFCCEKVQNFRFDITVRPGMARVDLLHLGDCSALLSRQTREEGGQGTSENAAGYGSRSLVAALLSHAPSLTEFPTPLPFCIACRRRTTRNA